MSAPEEENDAGMFVTLSGPKEEDADRGFASETEATTIATLSETEATTTATPNPQPDDTRVNLGPPKEETPETPRQHKIYEFLLMVCAFTIGRANVWRHPHAVPTSHAL